MDNLIPDELKLQSIQIALKKMFNDGYFDICTFDKCAKLAGVEADPEIRDFWLQCIALILIRCLKN